MLVLAIDPGTTESGWVLINDTYEPLKFAKEDNKSVMALLYGENDPTAYHAELVIERIAAYGMRVGQEVFDTAWWSGRFYGAEMVLGKHMIYRRDVKIHLCSRANVKDADIIQALIDRFAYGVPNKGKGTKDNPGWFYGFSKDVWQAYALGVTFIDQRKAGLI